MVWLGMRRVIPVEAKLLTWECTTTFDEIPALETLESLFESEFPRTCRRLQESGGFYRIWHLVSFNSSEGRRSRFLVALVEKPLEKRKFENIRRRALPEQIWLSAAADQMIRALPESDNAGNYLCYGYAGNTLCILVFFEGRLCHWSEESFAENCSRATLDVRMEQAVSRFRRFLESDALFSRAKHFDEISLQEKLGPEFSLSHFKVAARDAFWRGRDLRKPEENSGLAFANVMNALQQKWVWLVLLAVIALLAPKLYMQLTPLNSGWSKVLNIPNPEPIELSLPPEWEESLEVRDSGRGADAVATHTLARPKRNCSLPDFSLRGVVAEKLAMVSVDGQSRTLKVGDSLESFAVHAVGREHVELGCGDSLLVRRVGE